MIRRLLTIGFVILLKLALFPSVASGQIRVVCIGDSQCEPGALFVEYLEQELGPDYEVVARGRRSWTTDRWIASGDFGTECADFDVVLISLGGNDLAHGRDYAHIRQNVRTLMDQIPWGRVRLIYRMEIPRIYYPRVSLARDGKHLTRRGARQYAEIVAPFLRVPEMETSLE